MTTASASLSLRPRADRLTVAEGARIVALSLAPAVFFGVLAPFALRGPLEGPYAASDALPAEVLSVMSQGVALGVLGALVAMALGAVAVASDMRGRHRLPRAERRVRAVSGGVAAGVVLVLAVVLAGPWVSYDQAANEAAVESWAQERYGVELEPGEAAALLRDEAVVLDGGQLATLETAGDGAVLVYRGEAEVREVG